MNTIHRQLRNMLVDSLAVIGLSWAWIRKKWYGTYTDRPDGSWNQYAENMMANFSDSGHPYFVPPVPLRGENYEAKEGEISLYTSTVVMKTSSCFSTR